MFGQCWVFSGLVTTVLRCLGEPYVRPIVACFETHSFSFPAGFNMQGLHRMK